MSATQPAHELGMQLNANNVLPNKEFSSEIDSVRQIRVPYFFQSESKQRVRGLSDRQTDRQIKKKGVSQTGKAKVDRSGRAIGNIGFYHCHETRRALICSELDFCRKMVPWHLMRIDTEEKSDLHNTENKEGTDILIFPSIYKVSSLSSMSFFLFRFLIVCFIAVFFVFMQFQLHMQFVEI